MGRLGQWPRPRPAPVGAPSAGRRPAPDWGEQPAEFSALVTPSSNASAKALLLRMTLTEEKTYCLTVIDRNVTVLHAMTELFKLQALSG